MHRCPAYFENFLAATAHPGSDKPSAEGGRGVMVGGGTSHELERGYWKNSVYAALYHQSWQALC